jgi:periplasmic protein TonB
MSGLRQLLRLEDKVAAESRRLENIGGPSMRWVAPMVLFAAVTLHGAILLLPAVRTRATPTAASPMPDFPLVWRRAPAPVRPLQPPAPPPSTRTASTTPAPPRPAASLPQATEAARALTTEPVPEPLPELAVNAISADIDAIIPNPDTLPPSVEFGPPSGLFPPNPPDAVPTLVERVAPIYPVAARSLRAEGNVTLRLAVLPDGSVDRAIVQVCSRRGLGFEAAALAAVKRWRYEPAPLQSGPRTVTATIHFQMQEVRP